MPTIVNNTDNFHGILLIYQQNHKKDISINLHKWIPIIGGNKFKNNMIIIVSNVTQIMKEKIMNTMMHLVIMEGIKNVQWMLLINIPIQN